ncbi:MAG TPA: hypothetical protein VLL08_11290 [Kineosporiaceae bacterium]|nr:hypothetical protein [Kineosporiaceae bacterium]
MGINLAADAAYAASRLTCVAVASDLEVYQRAVTLAGPRGQVCPSTGGAGFRAFTWHGSDLSAQHSSTVPNGSERPSIAARKSAVTGASRVMNSIQLSKPRTGYCAMSGTG